MTMLRVIALASMTLTQSVAIGRIAEAVLPVRRPVQRIQWTLHTELASAIAVQAAGEKRESGWLHLVETRLVHGTERTVT